MKSMTVKFICRMLVFFLVMLPLQTGRASMIDADQVVTMASPRAEREAVLSLMSRSDVASQLQRLGVDLRTAKDRVAAMTDEEVHSLAGKLDSLPAGALSHWAILAVILLGILIWYEYNKK